jgi:hypothetical protein
VSDYPKCSAKACGAPASWVLVWNNPKLHQPDYEKRWLACDDHRDSLSGFLGLRGLLRRVEDLRPAPPTDQVPGRTAPK